MNITLEDPILREQDARAVLEHALQGRTLDPEIARRVRERSLRATEETRRRFGTVQVAVELVRQARNEE